MLGVELCSALYSQMMQNNADKKFSTDKYNIKTLRR